MVQVEGEYYVDYEPEKVFKFLNRPRTLSDISPTMKNSKPVGKADNGGWIILAEYEVAGGIASGETELEPEVFEKNQTVKYSIDDDIKGYLKWDLTEHSGGTKFTYEAKYSVEIPVPDLFMKTVGVHLSKRELDKVAENLKDSLDCEYQ